VKLRVPGDGRVLDTEGAGCASSRGILHDLKKRDILHMSMSGSLRPRIDHIATAHSKRPVMPRIRLRSPGSVVPALAVALRRRRWVEQLALPLAVVVVAGLSGMAIAALIHPGSHGGLAASEIAGSVRGWKGPTEPSGFVGAREIAASPPRARSADLPQAASSGYTLASPIGTAPAPGVGLRKKSVKAVDGVSGSDAPVEDGVSETPVSPAPSNPGAESGAEKPTPEAPPAPAPILSIDFESTLGQLGVNVAIPDAGQLLDTVLADVGIEPPPQSP
jgi:hypothetical protein